jgi:predicted Ser/Thr protein kinase
MSCPRCNAPAAEETLREFGGVCPKCLLDFSEEQDAPAFPNLEIVEMLGQGGMGVVYKAVQKNLGRTVALKVLSPHLSADPEFVERFTREARALASLNHPNIVGIYDSGIHDHVPFLVMEYVDGTPLRKMLASRKLTPERVLEVIPQICDALYYAHAQGVVHRDIKPENILVDRQGRVKIADFGLAKLASLDEARITKTGYVMGSPHYMAPEQFENSGHVDHRADIYSLGVVFYEMLTGEVPMGRFKPPSAKAPVDQRLDPVVLKSLEREPEDRWQSADEVKARVARLDEEAEPTPARKRQTLLTVTAIALVFGLTMMGLLYLLRVSGDASDRLGGLSAAPGRIIGLLVLIAAVTLTTVVLFIKKESRPPSVELQARAANLEPLPPQTTFVWNEVPIRISCALDPKQLYGNTITTVYVDGRNLGSPSGIFFDRLVGPFRDRQGVDHTIEVQSGWSGYKVLIDGTLVWRGEVPTQNSGYGCAMGATWLLGIAAMAAVPFITPWLLFAVIPAFVIAVVALIRRGLKPRDHASVRAPERSDDRKKKIAMAVVGTMVAVGIAAALWFDRTPAPHSPEDDMQIAIGGPVLVIGGMVVALVLLSGPMRGKQFRRIEPLTPARKQAMIAGIGAGGVALIAVVILTVGVRSKAPPLPSTPATRSWPATPRERGRPTIKRGVGVAVEGAAFDAKNPFTVNDYWPTGSDLPEGFEKATRLTAEDLIEKAQLPDGLVSSLEYTQGLDFENGHALIVGLQFRSELERRRWQKEPAWERFLETWHCRFLGNSQGVLLVRHDGSTVGRAATEMLTAYLDRKWRENLNAADQK